MKTWLDTHFPQAHPEAADRLQVFLHELAIWNAKFNLTRLPSDRWMDNIIAESAVLLDAAGSAAGPEAASEAIWMDMGTGAGIPGLVIAALCPSRRICLVDSRQKKTDFIRCTVSRMRLTNVEVIAGRLERLPFSHPELLRGITVFFSRALAEIPVLIRYADPFARNGAILLSPRGGSEPENDVHLPLKNGRLWRGRIEKRPVPGFQRMLTCARLVLEAFGDEQGIP